MQSLCLITLLFVAPLCADTHYVAVSSTTPVAPYTNWATAAMSIQPAIDMAEPGDIVLVSNGIYASGTYVTPGYSSKNRVVITTNILVASVNGSDVTIIRGQGPLGASAVRCVYMSAGVLCGFTLTNGFTHISGDEGHHQSGGGVDLYLGSGTISNCIITGNSAYYVGGGALGGTINDSTISANSALYGGGTFLSTVSNCTIKNNFASLDGGGTSGGTVNNSLISGNYAGSGGGTDYTTVNNSLIVSNRAAFAGGGTQYGTISHCTISSNQATYGGGTCFSTVYNSTISDNGASWAGGGSRFTSLSNCTVNGNNATYDGGGIQASAAYYSRISGNSAADNGGGACDSTLDNCSLSDNRAAYGGAAGWSILNNCTVTSNWAYDKGGGTFLGTNSNCLIASNIAGSGGGVYGGILYNCTVCDNYATNTCGGTYDATLYNSIVWANTAAQSDSNYCGGSFVYSCAAPLPSGDGNISNDPSFVIGGYELAHGSPCVDTGTNAFALMPVDLAGKPRIYNGTVDMGCFEFVPEPAAWASWTLAATLVRNSRQRRGARRIRNRDERR